MSSNPIPGFISKPSQHSVPETIQRLSALLKSKGVAIFALVDHSGEAEKAGLKMRPTQLLIFGNPKAGTPLMARLPVPQLTCQSRRSPGKTATAKCGLAIIRPTTSSSAMAFPPSSKRTLQQSSLFSLRPSLTNSRSVRSDMRSEARKETPNIQYVARGIY